MKNLSINLLSSIKETNWEIFYFIYVLSPFSFRMYKHDSSSSGSSSSASGTLDLSLVVESSSPSDGTSSVSRSTTIAVTFSKAMDPTTIDANYSSTKCSGHTVILDGFTTCVRFTSAPIASNSNRKFTVTPASSLSANTLYQIGVLRTNPRDTNGNAMYYSWSSANGFVTSGTTIAQFGSSSADYGYDIAIDSSDNLY